MSNKTAEHIDIAGGFVDKLAFYINPEIYKLEKEYKEGGSKFEHINSEFVAQSAYGRATGIARSSPELERILKESYKKSEEMRTGKVPGTLYLNNRDTSDEGALG